MQALEFDHSVFEAGFQNEADKSLLVKFFYKPRQDVVESEKEGRPVFKEVLYVSIDAAGNRLGGVCRPASQQDINRFPLHYQAFMNRTSTDGVIGTLLSEWPKITRSQAEELAFLKIKTVEQLAEVSDGNGSQIMNFHALKTAAKNWLVTAKDQNASAKLKEELDQIRSVNAALVARLEALEGQGNVTPIEQAVKTVVKPVNKGGRPRKNPLPVAQE